MWLPVVNIRYVLINLWSISSVVLQRMLLFLQGGEQGEGEDCSKDLYGDLPMNRSQEKRPVTHTPFGEIGRNLANQTITVRARLHTSRGKGTQYLTAIIKDERGVACCTISTSKSICLIYLTYFREASIFCSSKPSQHHTVCVGSGGECVQTDGQVCLQHHQRKHY